MPFLEWLILKWSFFNRCPLIRLSKSLLPGLHGPCIQDSSLLLAFGWGRRLGEEVELTTGLMWRERHDSSTEFLCFGERAEVAGKRRPGTFEEWRHSSLVTFHCRKMQTCSFLSFSLPLVLNFSHCFYFSFYLFLLCLCFFFAFSLFAFSLSFTVSTSIFLCLSFFLLPYFPFHTVT